MSFIDLKSQSLSPGFVNAWDKSKGSIRNTMKFKIQKLDDHSGHEELLATLFNHHHTSHHGCGKIIHTLKKSVYYIHKSVKFKNDQET